MTLMMVPLESGRTRWRRNGDDSGFKSESQTVFALVVAPTEELDRRPVAWAVNGYGEWLPLGHEPDQGRLA